MIPAEPAASKSILSTPTPALPMTDRPWLASITSALSFVALRTIIASKPSSAPDNKSDFSMYPKTTS